MPEIVICQTCDRPEFEGEMRWHNGRCLCRACYRRDYEDTHHRSYTWTDLDGPVPSIEDYWKYLQSKQAAAR